MTVMSKPSDTQRQQQDQQQQANRRSWEMLSRIAESMFWIGRYVERAEDTARLLQTHLRMLIEDTTAAEVDACRNLLALMNVDRCRRIRR